VRSRVELFEEIRRDQRREGLSIRELASRHGVHRRSVRQALTAAVPPPRAVYPARACPAIDPWREVIDGWLLADLDVPRKQRHTARRVWQRLVAEHQARVAEVTVSRYVRRRRIELGIVDREVFVPQVHEPGAEAEVDFGELYVTVDGQPVKCWMFVMRLSASGKAFHVVYGTQAQEAFLEGHVRAFEYFGGVPGRVRYDNLKPAVVRVLKGRDRQESERFIAMRSTYGFDSFFCIPGRQGAHEKGGVEGEIGRTLTVGAHFGQEKQALMPLPSEPFDPAVLADRRVDHRSRVSVRQCYYSVPVRYVGRRLTVRLTATTVQVLDGPRIVAAHVRAIGRYVDVLCLDHYLEVLARKPGAFPGATALAQAKASGAFTVSHQRYWDAARRDRGDGPGTRALVEVLLAHRTLPARWRRRWTRRWPPACSTRRS
jgi:transposase